MIRLTLSAVAACCLVGCLGGVEPPRLSDLYEVCATERAKLGEVRSGMTESEVTHLMGPPSLRFFNGERYEHEARPQKRESRRLANGWEVVALYYRARVVHHDGVCALDETQAVVLVNGKVDSLMPGEAVERFLRNF
jgi:hypothetical protein